MACLKIPPMASVSEQQQTFLIVICHAGDKSKKKKRWGKRKFYRLKSDEGGVRVDPSRGKSSQAKKEPT